MQKQKNSAREALQSVCVCGAMVAAAVIMGRFLAIPAAGVTTIWRVEFSFLAIAIVAYLYGPLWAGAAYGIADVVGAAYFYHSIDPFISLQKVLMGVAFGLFMHKSGGGKIGHRRILSCQLLTGVLLDAFVMILIFHYGQWGHPWEYAITTRSINAVVNVAIRSVVLVIFDKSLFPRLGRMRKEQHV